MVLRVKPTSTRFQANSLFAPMNSISSVRAKSSRAGRTRKSMRSSPNPPLILGCVALALVVSIVREMAQALYGGHVSLEYSKLGKVVSLY